MSLDFSLLPAHPRALIRRAAVRLILEDELLLSVHNGRVFPNREEPYLEDELPAIGVYISDEQVLDTSNRAPQPDWRTLTLNIESVVMSSDRLEEALDAISFGVERIFGDINMLGAAMQQLGGEDSLLELSYLSSNMDLADDGKRLLGVISSQFSVSYEVPSVLPELPDFLRATVDIDVYPSDGVAEISSDLKVRGF